MNSATTSSSCYFLPLLTPVVSAGVTFQELNVLNFCSFSRYKQVKWLVRTVTKLLISISPTSTTEHGWWHPKTCSLTSMNIYYGSRRYTSSLLGKKVDSNHCTALFQLSYLLYNKFLWNSVQRSWRVYEQRIEKGLVI